MAEEVGNNETESLAKQSFDVNEASDADAAFDDEYHNVTWEELRGTRKRRLAFLLIAAFAVIGISIGVGVAVGSSGGGSDSNGVSLAPPDNLEVICAPSNLETEEGYSSCLNACHPSQCCELVDSNPFSCVDDNRKECSLFHASCQHLSQKKKQDSASGEVVVDKKCSSVALTTEDGVNSCKGICKDYMCCFPGPQDYEPCDVSQAWCAEYSACSALNYVDQDGFDSHEEAKETVEDACSDVASLEGFTECTNICRTSQCCFAKVEFPTGNDCSHVNCTHYEACHVLYGQMEEPATPPVPGGSSSEDDDDDDDFYDPDDDEIDDATQAMLLEMRVEVAEACRIEKFNTLEGVQKCFGLCQHHLCCFDSFPGESCASRLGDECEVYHECRRLAENSLPVQNPDDLALLCDDPMFVSQGPQSCLNSCALNLCCTIDTRLASSCELTNDSCKDYPPCEVLKPDTVIEESNLVADVETYCSDSQLSTKQGVEKCRSYCKQRECCIKTGVGSCLQTDPDFCGEIIDCQTLNEIDESNLVDAPANPVTPPPVPSPPAPSPGGTLEKVCNDDTVTNATLFKLCYQACHEDLCCFASTSQNAFGVSLNCRVDRPTECQEHEACSVLVQSDVPNATKELVDSKCSDFPIDSPGDFKECHRMCGPHLCCLEEPGSRSFCNDLLDPGKCEIYHGCHVLLEEITMGESNVGEQPKPSNNAPSCTEDNVSTLTGFHDCYDECYNHMCCFFEESLPQGELNCKNDKPAECAEFSSCSTVADVEILAATKDAVDAACLSPQIGMNDVFRECRLLCATHLCCFQPPGDPSSCRSILGQAECDTYNSCAFLVTTDEHPNPFENDDPYLVALVEAYCTTEKLQTTAGEETCRRHCDKRKCCFESTGCGGTSDEYCAEIEACSPLYSGFDD